MWISELAERSGVAVATIKYYLREELLPAGESAGATRRIYNQEHVERLRLIRALVEVAGMSLDRVRDVLTALNQDELHDILGSVHVQLTPELQHRPEAESVSKVRDVISDHQWQITTDDRHSQALAAALDSIAAVGQPISRRTLNVYAQAAQLIASAELADMPTVSKAVSATYVATGTVLAEPVLMALRRMAHQSESAQRFE